jgi:hypothetical protein
VETKSKDNVVFLLAAQGRRHRHRDMPQQPHRSIDHRSTIDHRSFSLLSSDF